MSTPTTAPKRRSAASRLLQGDASWQFVARRRLWYLVTALLVLASIVAFAVRGLDLGIEFTGGADFTAATHAVDDRTVGAVRTAVENAGVPDLGDVNVTTVGGETIRVQTRTLDAETEVPKVRQAISSVTGSDQVAYSLIGKSWGEQITGKAGIALVVFLVLVLILIAIYFRDLRMSVAAVVALLHDLVLTVGVYALIGFTVTPATVIGLLTILGYSLYDTVVVFDKVRENTVGPRALRGRTFADAANVAVNQVLVRSINTTIIGVLPVLAILVAGWGLLGTGPLPDLGLVLFVGMIAGAFSSIFLATPLLVDMRRGDRVRVADGDARPGGDGGDATGTTDDTDPDDDPGGSDDPDSSDTPTDSARRTDLPTPLTQSVTKTISGG